MKRFSILPLALVLTLILSACGAQATPIPTLDPVNLLSTSAAVAFTMVAQTQAAIPTATPIPPTATFTNTPLPTPTVPPLTGAAVTFTAIPNSNAGAGDPCINQVLPALLPGQTVRLRLNNSTRADLSVSVNLHQATPQSVCGYRSYTLTQGQSIVINDLVVGCYTIWAWNPIPEEYFIVTNGTTCVDTSENWVFDISTGSIRVRN